MVVLLMNGRKLMKGAVPNMHQLMSMGVDQKIVSGKNGLREITGVIPQKASPKKRKPCEGLEPSQGCLKNSLRNLRGSPGLRGFQYLPLLDARCADPHALGSAVHLGPDVLQVREPAPARLVVGVVARGASHQDRRRRRRSWC